MFIYLSFLRPPPVHCSTSCNITITPQVANDLRTELFDGRMDIYYLWTPDGDQDSSAPLIPSKAAKLTTWRQENAYKDIPVPPPRDVRDGQRWRLRLIGAPSSSDFSHIPTSGAFFLNDHGSHAMIPLAVTSMPILFSSLSHIKRSAKQEQIERVFQLRSRAVDHKGADYPSLGPVALRLFEKTSFDLDKTIS